MSEPSMSVPEVAFGLLLLTAVWAPLGATALALAHRLLRGEPDARPELHALSLALGLPVLLVAALGRVGAIGRDAALAGLVALTVAMASLAGASARRDAATALRAALGHAADALRGRSAALLAAGGAALACGVGAAALTAPWGWDSLGYHLPIVYDAIQTGRFGEVVSHVPYVGAYPKAVEAFFVAFALTLPDDRLIELGQMPFALAGVVTAAVIARRAGATPARSLGYAAAWLCVPGVLLQLAQNYVDVGHAALLLLAGALVTGPLSTRGAWTTALTLGLLLASKPSAPVPFALLGALWLARSRATRDLRWRALVALVAAALLGGTSYLGNLFEHGNPVYPVALDLGPLHLPGHASPSQFFSVGTPPGFAQRAWIDRVARSWRTIPDAYVYDMRLGWHGPVWWVLLALAPLLASPRLRRGVAAPTLLVSACALATPAAFWPRFTLAMPAALLASAAVVASRLGPRARASIDAAVTAASIAGLALASGGLTGEGASLFEIARAPERATSVSADGQLDAWIAARRRVRPGRRFVYDESVDLPGALWRPDRRVVVSHMPGAALLGRSPERLRALGIDALAVDRDGATARRLDARPDAAERLFSCRVGRCAVYALIGDAP